MLTLFVLSSYQILLMIGWNIFLPCSSSSCHSLEVIFRFLNPVLFVFFFLLSFHLFIPHFAFTLTLLMPLDFTVKTVAWDFLTLNVEPYLPLGVLSNLLKPSQPRFQRINFHYHFCNISPRLKYASWLGTTETPTSIIILEILCHLTRCDGNWWISIHTIVVSSLGFKSIVHFRIFIGELPMFTNSLNRIWL